MKAVLGIGNPGQRYDKTRHNVGFWVIDALSERLKAGHPTDDHGAKASKTSIRGETILLLKPQTFVNLSGQTVRSVMRKGLIAPDLFVVCDDINLPLGRIRVRPGGGDGGHNGLRSIIETLGNNQFPRVRVGVGAPPAGTDAADFVLESFEEEEWPLVHWAVCETAKALSIWLRRNDLSMMMNRLNQARVPLDPRDPDKRDKEEDV